MSKGEISLFDLSPASSTHQQLAGYLASRRHDLILAEAGLHQIGDKQLEPVGRTRVAGLAEVGRKDKVLRADLVYCRDSLLDLYPPPVPHPCQMCLRSH